MDYNRIHDELIQALLERESVMGFDPNHPMVHKHGVVPPSCSHLNPSRLKVFVSAPELFILRKLLTKIYPDVPAVHSAFKHIKNEYFANNHRDVIRAQRERWCQLEIDDLTASLERLREGAWDDMTMRVIDDKEYQLKIKRKQRQRYADELEDQAAAYLGNHNIAYRREDREADAVSVLLDEATLELQPELRQQQGLGTSFKF